MYRILIVDDEKSHRSGLMKLLYSYYPEDMLLEADSGEQAMELLKMLECDIVITDIRMSGMDGLELLQNIRVEFEKTEVVILSGYGEFEYAREAIRHGAKEYLLKPVDPQELYKCMERVKQCIREKKETDNNIAFIEKELRETEPVYLEYLMRQFVSDPNFVKKDRLSGLFPLDQPGWLFLCELKYENERDVEADNRDFRIAVKKYVEPASAYAFQTETENLFAVLVLSSSKGNRTFFENLRKYERDSRYRIVNVFVSRIYENMLSDAPAAYREVRELWKYRFYELGDYYDYDLHSLRIGGILPPVSKTAALAAECVKQNNVTQGFQKIKEQLDFLSEDRLPDPVELCRTCMLTCFQILKEVDTMVSEEFRQGTEKTLDAISCAETINRLKTIIYAFLLNLGKDVHYQRETRGLDVLEHCRDYLESHYMEEITLEDVAEKYYFNSSYFSTLFHNYFGKSFTGYLIDVRMRHAGELLSDPDRKIRDVASLTGYRDANYFIRAFKKYYGYTPEEYRKIRAQDLMQEKP